MEGAYEKNHQRCNVNITMMSVNSSKICRQRCNVSLTGGCGFARGLVLLGKRCRWSQYFMDENNKLESLGKD